VSCCGGLIIVNLSIHSRSPESDRCQDNRKYFRVDWIRYRDSNIPLSIPQMTLPQLALILGTLGVFVVYWRSGQRHRRHLPPGPKKLPLIGNLLSMPTKVEWETYAKWGKEYSLCLITRTIFISCLGQTPTLFTSTL
jgi:hypothetical protein